MKLNSVLGGLVILTAFVFSSCNKDTIRWSYSGDWYLYQISSMSGELSPYVESVIDYYPDDESMDMIIYQARMPTGQKRIELKGIPLKSTSSTGNCSFYGENVVLHGTSEIANKVEISAKKGRLRVRISLDDYSIKYTADDGTSDIEGES